MSDRPDPGEQSKARLYRAALGEAWAEHYLPVFARFDREGVAGPAWNGAAALLHLGWLVHHRLWRPLAACSALALAIALAVAGWWHFALAWPFGVKLGGSLALLLVVCLVPGLWGSAWLHARLRQRVIEAVAQAPTMDAACETLSAQARLRQRHNTWGLAGLLGTVALAVLLWQTVPWRSLLGHAATVPPPSKVALAPDGAAEPPTATPAVVATAREGSGVDAVKPAASTFSDGGDVDAADEGSSASPALQGLAPSASQPTVQIEAQPVAPKGAPPTAAVDSNHPAEQVKVVVDRVAPPQAAKSAVSARVRSKVKARPPGVLKADSDAPVTGVAKRPVEAVATPTVPGTAAAAVDGIRPRVKGFGVAVGMFAVTANAERVIATLQRAGLPVISDPVASARGELTRVRVGPFDRRAQALAAAVKVKALGLDAKVYAP